jgi:hypothetical protein
MVIAMEQPNLITRAKQGDIEAIAHLIQVALQPHGIHVRKIRLQDHCLYLTLRSEQVPNQVAIVNFIQQGMTRLKVPSIHLVRIQATQTDMEIPSWSHEICLSSAPSFTPVQQDDEFTTLNVPSCSTQAQSRSPRSQPVTSRPKTTPKQLKSQKKQDLGFLFLERFDLLKLGFLGLLAFHSVFGSQHYTIDGFLDGSDFVMGFLHNVNLIFHEAGHLILILFGQLIHLLGGSLMQIVVPASLCYYFFNTRQHYASTIALWWVGQNFLDVSIYIKDAQEQSLPLIGGEASLHDWHHILLDLRLLAFDDFIGNLAYTIGILIYAVAIVAGAYYTQKPVRVQHSDDQS